MLRGVAGEEWPAWDLGAAAHKGFFPWEKLQLWPQSFTNVNIGLEKGGDHMTDC
jgi:hypothetical protein